MAAHEIPLLKQFELPHEPYAALMVIRFPLPDDKGNMNVIHTSSKRVFLGRAACFAAAQAFLHWLLCPDTVPPADSVTVETPATALKFSKRAMLYYAPRDMLQRLYKQAVDVWTEGSEPMYLQPPVFPMDAPPGSKRLRPLYDWCRSLGEEHTRMLMHVCVHAASLMGGHARFSFISATCHARDLHKLRTYGDENAPPAPPMGPPAAPLPRLVIRDPYVPVEGVPARGKWVAVTEAEEEEEEEKKEEEKTVIESSLAQGLKLYDDFIDEAEWWRVIQHTADFEYISDYHSDDSEDEFSTWPEESSNMETSTTSSSAAPPPQRLGKADFV